MLHGFFSAIRIYFNSVQSESFQDAFLSDSNMIISAPTGSGKTVLFELCILRLLSGCLTPEGNFNSIPGSLKAVYIGPLKALVQEKHRDWNRKFGKTLSLKCHELTGDTEQFNINHLQETDIILTTPEKFDSITRRHRDFGGLSFFGDIALILIDEVHLLGDKRGASLEAVISRMKMLSRYPEMRNCPLSKIRFVAVSATIPNIDDLAEWLMVPKRGIKRFGEEVRPVKLTTKVIGYAPAKNDFLFERKLQNFVFDILMQHSKGKSALVFCSTRKGAQEAALTLAETASKFGSRNPFLKSYEQYERLQVAAISTNDKNMQVCIKNAVGYHNGGLGFADRNLVENLFLSRDVRVLCTTNTLAHGVNLPAHTVIIKSTQYFSKEKGGYSEYDRGSILQMCGRAGRPQFDNDGVAIIMTRKETVPLYENLLLGCEPVESELFTSIAEHLNAEIVLMTVSDVSRAIDWLMCSFLYVRIKKNPAHYHINHCDSAEQLEKQLKDICLQYVKELSAFGLVETDEDGYMLRPLEPGRLMAKYYLCFSTMKLIVKCKLQSSTEDLLHILCQAQEIKWIKLRRAEKKILNDINSDVAGRLRFHLVSSNGKAKKRIQTAEEKIFVLMNDALSGEPSSLDFSLNQDVNGIVSNGKRIARCMSDYFILKRKFSDSMNALTLSKCLSQRLWEDSPYQLKQLPGIGMVTAKVLLGAGINSFEKLQSADPRRLESLTGRKYPFGNHVKESLDALPPVITMNFLNIPKTSKHGVAYILELSRSNQVMQHKKKHFADVVIGTESDNNLLFHEKIRLDQFSSPYQITVRPSTKVHSGDLVASIISEEYVGLDSTIRYVSDCEERSNYSNKGSNECTKEVAYTGGKTPHPLPTAECSKLCYEKSHSITNSAEETWSTRAFSEPTFRLLPAKTDSFQRVTSKRDCLGSRISTHDDSETQAKESTAQKKDICTKRSVFDHIKSKARKLSGITGVTSVNKSACSDSTNGSGYFYTYETLANDLIPAKTGMKTCLELDDRVESLGKHTAQANEFLKVNYNVNNFGFKEESHEVRSNVASDDMILPSSPNKASTENSTLSITSDKQFSTVSDQIPFGSEGIRPSFMGCRSIFTFL
ncbi:hypothetical protein KP509_22G005100 [Ceratopteris richardii]|uniref:DNA 3'-5' helicase n=1 Tax=Ceratopteris richardii TaxID=49495 RepID=A0A8T2S293_CERRI|nr:hypothetical protein KP509_22G005100 [Ceratopteris richardii]